MITLSRVDVVLDTPAVVLGQRLQPEDGANVTMSMPGQRSDRCRSEWSRKRQNAVYNLRERQGLTVLRDVLK